MKMQWIIAMLLAVLSVMLISQLVGCGDDDDDDTDNPFNDDDDDVGDDDDNDDNDDNDDTTAPGVPFVEQPTSPTNMDTARIKGVAEAGTWVRVTGGANDAFEPSDPSTGAFCFYIFLNPEQVNNLEVTAVDVAENESEPALLTVEQIPTQPDSNLALNKPAEASSVSTGHPEKTPDKAVDGNMGTSWNSSENHLNPQWFMVDLVQFTEVSSFKIYWHGSDLYAIEYSFRIHTDEFVSTEPTDPSWVKVWETSAGNGDLDEIFLAQPVGAKWAAIVLEKSASGGLLKNDYEIDEFEVIGHPSVEPQTCN